MCQVIPLKVLRVDGEQVEVFDESGVGQWVLASGIPDIRVGEYIIVHAGIALDQISEAEALEIFQLYDELARMMKEIVL